jgi:ribonuclease-3
VVNIDREACERIVGYSFRNPSLLDLAMTHSSSKTTDGVCNERLEFLGDAILGMVISKYLYDNFPEYSEGDLTRVKSVVVSRPILAVCAREMGLQDFVRVGRGLGQRKLPRSVLANIFEAIIAAIYEDAGLERATKFVLDHLAEQVQTVVQDRHEKNYKSILQQYAQKEMTATPTYRVTTQKGPDHAKQFEVIAVINGKDFASGWGRSKKEAEQKAAELTLELLLRQNGGVESPSEPS